MAWAVCGPSLSVYVCLWWPTVSVWLWQGEASQASIIASLDTEPAGSAADGSRHVWTLQGMLGACEHAQLTFPWLWAVKLCRVPLVVIASCWERSAAQSGLWCLCNWGKCFRQPENTLFSRSDTGNSLLWRGQRGRLHPEELGGTLLPSHYYVQKQGDCVKPGQIVMSCGRGLNRGSEPCGSAWVIV